MTLSRRNALGLLAGSGALAALGGCGAVRRVVQGPPPPFTPPSPQTATDAGTLARFGYGVSADNPREIADLGRKLWFESQLDAPATEDPLPILLKLRRLDINHFTAYELRDLPQPEILRQLQAAATIRAVESPWQLRERLVDFWSNHFSIFARKGLAAYRKPQDEREVIRAHALGSFPDMLRASARSTAMLLYLDQHASSLQQPNENYARELLELHSLGVDGGYTQKDVMEVARCFTGWTEERRFMKPRGQFRFREDLHDDGEKIVLGHRIPAGGGVKDGERVIEIVANHPATAAHVSRKLCKFFLGRDDAEVSDPVIATYRESRGNVKAMLRVIFQASEDGKAVASVKRPFDYCVSAMRALGATTDGGADFQTHLAAMGQPLYQWPMPDGFPVDALSWSGSMLARWNFALELAQGSVKKTGSDGGRLNGVEATHLVAALLAQPTEAPAVHALVARLPSDAEPQRLAALILASPEFQWRHA